MGPDQPTEPTAAPPRTEVVIIGAGFAGLEVAKALGRAGIDTIIIDRRNHHLFQPLLYQVATAALSAADVGEPIRKILRKYKSVRVMFAEVSQIDPATRRIDTTCGNILHYRSLVLASGSGHSYFGNDHWAEFAPGLKSIEDARHIRSELLLAFERAERTHDPAERQRMLNIAIIGGGPTGVEMAGSIAELSRHALSRDFRNIDPRAARIQLVEAGPRVLSGFSEDISAYAHSRLERLGVEVRTGGKVEDITATSLTIDGVTEPVGLVIWAAGVAASPLAQPLGETDRSGRIAVDETLAVRGQPDVYALGDVALFKDEDDTPLPGLAQVAKQQGVHLGKALAAKLRSATPLPPFRYRSRGNTAIVGRNIGVYEYGRLRLTGWFAWLGWALVHVYMLAGRQNRFLVSMQWLWRYLTYERGARLIDAEHVEPGAPRPEEGEKARDHRAGQAAG